MGVAISSSADRRVAPLALLATLAPALQVQV
jgi:hypothetical protein